MIESCTTTSLSTFAEEINFDELLVVNSSRIIRHVISLIVSVAQNESLYRA